MRDRPVTGSGRQASAVASAELAVEPITPAKRQFLVDAKAARPCNLLTPSELAELDWGQASEATATRGKTGRYVLTTSATRWSICSCPSTLPALASTGCLLPITRLGRLAAQTTGLGTSGCNQTELTLLLLCAADDLGSGVANRSALGHKSAGAGAASGRNESAGDSTTTHGAVHSIDAVAKVLVSAALFLHRPIPSVHLRPRYRSPLVFEADEPESLTPCVANDLKLLAPDRRGRRELRGSLR